tara:strand:+ start:4472 stop:5374 length:903 start_codon:yes stop_codon:yes gene_type:complete
MASYQDPPVTTNATYEEPYAGAMRRGFLESAANLAKQPIPMPVQQIAGLDPYEMRARELAGGLGGFTPYIQQGSQMMQTGAGYYTPTGIQQFYNPYEADVVQQTMQDLQKQNLQRGIADRDRAISSGAFGGSRGRLMEQERERAFGRGMMEGIGGIRSKGWGQAMQGAQTAGQGLGAMGSNFGQLGITGQQGLMNQINAFNQMGGVGRDIQDQMYGAQFDAAKRTAREPWQRMQGWQNMMQGMMPQTRSQTTWNPMASPFDPLRGLSSILGLNLPGWAGGGSNMNLQQALAVIQKELGGG